MDRIRAFYADKVGRYPAQFTEPRLAEETAAGIQSTAASSVDGAAC
jgi:hypothetical protein